MIIVKQAYAANFNITSNGAHNYNVSGSLDITGGGMLNVSAVNISYSAARLFIEKMDNDSIAAGEGAIRVFDMTESLYK